MSLVDSFPVAHEATDARETLLPIIEGMTRALGYTRALVLLHDGSRGTLRGTLGLNVSERLVEAVEIPVTAAHNPLVAAFLTGAPVRVNDAAHEQRLGSDAMALLLEMELRAFVAAPLQSTLLPSRMPDARERQAPGMPTVGGREIASVGLVVLGRDEPITDTDVERIMPLATHAGTTIVSVSDTERLRDSSERHAVEKEWLWWMVNGVADPVVLTDQNNDIVLHNMRAESLFRTNPDDSEGKRRAISMNNFLFTAALSTAALERGAPAGRELTLIDPIEGEELLFEVISTPATNYVNGARGYVNVLKNITDLRHATEELSHNVHRLQTADEEIRQERDRLNLLLRSVPNPIILMDNANQIILMNQEASRLFRAPGGVQGQAGGRRAQVCLSNDTKFTSFVATLALDPAEIKHGELALSDPDTDEDLAMAVTSTEVRDEVGAVVATVSVLQDISRLRELERRRVEQVLFESEKLAATGRLAASIAHEINNPLEAIKNALYLLTTSDALDDQNRRFLEIASKETERVSRILRQMLGFYRPPKMEETNLNAVIEEAEALVDKYLRRERVSIANDLDADLPRIVGSADQLKQVFLNLLLNAVDAMPGGGKIQVSTRVAHDAEPELLRADAVQIRIEDSGKGIAEEHLPHIFDPFFSTKLQEKGTGIGLWVSLGIVQNHGGTIRVRSRVGRGTTFSITLPINGPAEAEADA